MADFPFLPKDFMGYLVHLSPCSCDMKLQHGQLLDGMRIRLRVTV